MTSLRSFQNDIEEIHLKEVAKQRAAGLAEWERENKKLSLKGSSKDHIHIVHAEKEQRKTSSIGIAKEQASPTSTSVSIKQATDDVEDDAEFQVSR